MVSTTERMNQQGIFCAIRLLVQELHSDKVILEDVHGTPFLFKSQDAQVWVRIFYRAMQDFSMEDLKREIQKLWLLMPREAVLYLFYPLLNREQIFKMNGISDRLSFFEYGYHENSLGADKPNIRICKWIPTVAFSQDISAGQKSTTFRSKNHESNFVQQMRLNTQEIADLTELILAVRCI